MHTHYWELSLEETFFNQEEDHSTAVRLVLEKNSLLEDNINKEELYITKALYFTVSALFKLFKNLRLWWIILLLQRWRNFFYYLRQ